MINHAIQATDLVPPRTTTAQMPAAPARLPATPITSPVYPPARQPEDYDREYLLEVAAAGAHRETSYELTLSRDHVEAICLELHDVQAEVLAARDAQQALATELEAARTDLAIAESLRVAALADANDLRALAARLSRENAKLRMSAAVTAGLNALALTVTGMNGPELADQLTIDARAAAEDCARRASLTAFGARAEQRSRAERAYRSQALVWDVSDSADTVVADVGGAL